MHPSALGFASDDARPKQNKGLRFSPFHRCLKLVRQPDDRRVPRNYTREALDLYKLLGVSSTLRACLKKRRRDVASHCRDVASHSITSSARARSEGGIVRPRLGGIAKVTEPPDQPLAVDDPEAPCQRTRSVV
jgi:hypothetical protein